MKLLESLHFGSVLFGAAALTFCYGVLSFFIAQLVLARRLKHPTWKPEAEHAKPPPGTVYAEPHHPASPFTPLRFSVRKDGESGNWCILYSRSGSEFFFVPTFDETHCKEFNTKPVLGRRRWRTAAAATEWAQHWKAKHSSSFSSFDKFLSMIHARYLRASERWENARDQLNAERDGKANL